jgi:hypothetical protein
MQYMVMCQNNNLLSTCFCVKHFTILRGHILIGEIDTTGAMPTFWSGDIVTDEETARRE